MVHERPILAALERCRPTSARARRALFLQQRADEVIECKGARYRKAPASCTEAGGSGAFPLTGDERPGTSFGATMSGPTRRRRNNAEAAGLFPSLRCASYVLGLRPAMGGMRYKKLERFRRA